MFTGMLALVYHTSCAPKKEVKEEAGKYTVTSPLSIDTAFTKEYVSQIRSVRNIEIRAREKGFLQNIYVDEGQFVKAGQLLFRTMPKMYEVELLKAQAEAKAAEIELQNARTLAGTEPCWHVFARHVRQDSGLWSALHQGVLTTGTLNAALGLYEPFAAQVLGIPKGFVGHGRLLAAYQNLLLAEYVPAPAAAAAGPSSEGNSQPNSLQAAARPEGNEQLQATQPVTAGPADLPAARRPGRRPRGGGRALAARAAAQREAEAAEKLARHRDSVCVRKAAEGISAVRCKWGSEQVLL